ncbi:hypothetical protein MKW92_044698 [Papaver armeniacum]|nr:hypothetical protein MKW92_044698 [Papaver armeniacum]
MGSSSTLKRNVETEISLIDSLPVYVKELIAGGAAGAFAKTTIAPLERIKILLQTRTEGFHSIGVYQSMKKLLKHEGCYSDDSYAALHFMTYEQYRCWILNNCPAMGTGPVVDLLAGSAAGGTAVLLTYPLDLARTKLAYQVTSPKEIIGHGLRGIHAQPDYCGLKDVFKSVYRKVNRPTLVGILPYAGLKFYIYEELKRRVPEEHQNSVMLRLSCGALAGLFGQTFTYPLDVVRRQMQFATRWSWIRGIRSEGFTTIIRNQWWGQLFAGLSINYRIAIGFTAYDMMKS